MSSLWWVESPSARTTPEFIYTQTHFLKLQCIYQVWVSYTCQTKRNIHIPLWLLWFLTSLSGVAHWSQLHLWVNWVNSRFGWLNKNGKKQRTCYKWRLIKKCIWLSAKCKQQKTKLKETAWTQKKKNLKEKYRPLKSVANQQLLLLPQLRCWTFWILWKRPLKITLHIRDSFSVSS